MKILVGFEMSGVVRDALIERGHQAISCDIVDSLKPGPHIKADIRTIDLSVFEAAIFFPPCTRLCRSGLQWIEKRGLQKEQEEAIELFMWCVNAPFEMIAIENPIGIMSTRYRKPDQIIHPWMFGTGETKATCLWLKGLQKLEPTNIVSGRYDRIHQIGPSTQRGTLRSITYPGLAKAMSEQWF